ncbi:low molecular weight protein-tyrosine-phosphatase [soil metagenome]
MRSVLFVCLGNICRSPLAEAIFSSQIHQKKLQAKFITASCGTANYHVGDPPDPRTIKNALLNGIEINHLGRQFAVSDFEEFDWIIPMDKSNLNNILRLPNAKNYLHKIRLMRTFDTEHTGSDVPDPYHGGEKDFQEVFDILTRSMSGLVKMLEEKAS